MDFVWSHFFPNAPLTSWTLVSSLWGTSSTTGTKKWWKKCSTGQRCIRKEVTSYKIHTLVLVWILNITNTTRLLSSFIGVRWKPKRLTYAWFLVLISHLPTLVKEIKRSRQANIVLSEQPNLFCPLFLSNGKFSFQNCREF